MDRGQGKHSKYLLPKIAHKSIYPLSLHWCCGWDTQSCSALLPAKDWGGRGAGASPCADLHVTAWQSVVQPSPPFHYGAYVKPKPQISFMTVDSLQIQTPGNISKKSLTMTKQIWASFTAVTGSFATEYQISDTGGKKKRKIKRKRCKRQCISSVEKRHTKRYVNDLSCCASQNMSFGAACCLSLALFLVKPSLCILSRTRMHSFVIFISSKAMKVITIHIWKWEIFFVPLLYVWLAPMK